MSVCGNPKCNLLLTQARPRMIQHLSSVPCIYPCVHTVGSSRQEAGAPPLQPGDVVEVSEGDLMHLQVNYSVAFFPGSLPLLSFSELSSMALSHVFLC